MTPFSLENVLVIRPGALGDAVLTLPVLAALQAAGAKQITVLGTRASWEFLSRTERRSVQFADFMSSAWLGLFKKGAELSSEARAILKQTQTALVCLTGDTTELEQRLNAFGIQTVLKCDPPVASQSGRLPHAARKLMEPLAPFISGSILEDAFQPDGVDGLSCLALTSGEINAARKFIAENCGDARTVVAIHPGSGGRKKCWPAERFAELTARISHEMNCVPLVLFGPADDRTRAEFEAAMPRDTYWLALAHRPLRELFALLHCCRAYAGNDSGVSHLAARATSVLAIFGPTNSEEWKPLGRKVQIIKAPNGALNELKAETVFEAVKSLIHDS